MNIINMKKIIAFIFVFILLITLFVNNISAEETNKTENKSGVIHSSDNKKAAWMEERESSGKIKYTLMVSDVDGTNKRKIFEQELDYLSKLILIRWSKDSNFLYFGKRFDGLGGAILYEYLENLHKIDIRTKKVTLLIGKERKYNNSDFISAFSKDERYLAYFEEKTNSHNIVIIDLKTKNTLSGQIPYKKKEIRCYGHCVFSENEQFIAFELALNEPSGQDQPFTMKYCVFDTKKKKITVYDKIDSIPDKFLVNGIK